MYIEYGISLQILGGFERAMHYMCIITLRHRLREEKGPTLLNSGHEESTA